MDFIYDNTGRPYAIVNGNATSASIYYYVLNQQGDVIRILGPNNTVAATYTYNAWGEVISSSGWMANQNPLRYRGYFQDNETGFYYLQSRYYDPSIGRFINADSYASTGQGFLGCNMFAYCGNNPVNLIDNTGTSSSAAITEKWLYTMAWLPVSDGIGPVGDIIYGAGYAVLTVFTIYFAWKNSDSENNVNTGSSTASVAAPSAPKPPKPPKKDKNKLSLQRVTKHLLKKNGLDAHDIKYEYLGNDAPIQLFDLFYDKNTGIIYILNKAGKVIVDTYYNVNGYFK